VEIIERVSLNRHLDVFIFVILAFGGTGSRLCTVDAPRLLVLLHEVKSWPHMQAAPPVK
jgi:hypothetical protein